MGRFIHPSAIVGEGAVIGEGVRIGAYAVVGGKAEIGEGCVLDSHAVVKDYVKLGARCHVHSFAVLGDIPQDHAFREAPSYVVTGTDCDFREGVTVHRGTKPGTATRIGNRVMMMANSHAAHNVVVGDDVILANGALLAGYVELGDHVFLSGNVTVHQFVRVGRLAMMGGLSAAAFDILPYCMTPPVTCSVIGSLNLVGMRRVGMGPEERKAVKEAFRIFFRSGLNTTQGIARIYEVFGGGPAREMADFAVASKRGIATAHFGARGGHMGEGGGGA